MSVPKACKLLFGPYRPPDLRKGDRAVWLASDCDVVVTGWSDSRISWPRCRSLGTHGGGSGLLVDEVLARAVRNEAAIAVRHWWGVKANTLAWWRRVLGVGRAASPGSMRLIQAASEAGAAMLKQNGWPDEACSRKAEWARESNHARFLRGVPPVPLWTAEELALLGTMPDDVLAARIGRSANAVRIRRTLLGIATARDRRRRDSR